MIDFINVYCCQQGFDAKMHDNLLKKKSISSLAKTSIFDHSFMFISQKQGCELIGDL